MAYNYSNYTDFGIHNTAERYTWAGYVIIIILSSLIGDSLILVSSIKYNAIKLHEILVAIMQHIAVCDIISALTLGYSLVSLLANGNVLGPFLCYARAYTANYVPPVSYYLVSALAVSKLMILKFPLRSISWTQRKAHLICFVIWIISMSFPVMLLTKDKNDVQFDYRSYVCSYGFSNPSHRALRPFWVSIALGVPCLVVVVASAMLISEARKGAQRHQNSLRWEGLLTVILTAVIYCLSLMPYTIYIIANDFVEENPPGLFHLYFYRFSIAVTSINLASNFYIYSLTVHSFREFLISRVKLLRASLPCSRGGNNANQLQKMKRLREIELTPS